MVSWLLHFKASINTPTSLSDGAAVLDFLLRCHCGLSLLSVSLLDRHMHSRGAPHSVGERQRTIDAHKTHYILLLAREVTHPLSKHGNLDTSQTQQSDKRRRKYNHPHISTETYMMIERDYFLYESIYCSFLFMVTLLQYVKVLYQWIVCRQNYLEGQCFLEF